MRKIIEKTTRIAAFALALAFGLGLTATGFAGLPTITVSGNDVTISFNSGSYGNIGTNNGGSDTITIPAATDLASGTVLRIKSISLGSRDSGTASPASITVAGVNSDAAVVTDDVYGTGRDKYTYNFSSPCLVKVGTASSVSYKNAAGQQVNVGLAAALITEAPDSYVFGLNSYSYNGTHAWGILSEIVAEKVKGYINETANGFNTTVTSDKVYVSGVTGYLNTPNGLFGTVDELVVVDGEYSFGHKIVNGNSPNGSSPNRGTAFKKLSGTGTITNGDHANQPTPVVGICDSSEFFGSINIGSGTTRPTFLFCTEAEINAGIEASLGATLQSLFTSVDGRARIYVSPGRTTANNAVVTVPAGKTWTAVNGIENRGELVVNGTVSCKIVNSGVLTVNGTVTGTISGSGTVVVNEGATIASFGSQRDFTGWTVDSSIPVKIAMTSEEYGKGSVSVTGATGISSITVFAPDGTTQVGTITPEAGAGTLETGVKVSGKACWIDYEMTYGNEKTGFENTGTSTLVLQKDSGIEGSNAFTDDGMLYTYAHPYRQSLTMPSTWTAVVRCTVPNYSDAAVITFGWNDNYIGLVAGETPRTEMRLVQYKSGYNHYITNAVMNVQDATTAQHVYIFAVENSRTLKVYCDGTQILNKVLDESLTITSGFQIGSVLGGATGGIVRFAKGESPANTLAESVQKDARIDCVRLYDYSLSADQIAALSAEFPAVKLYEATVEADADTTWGVLAWSNDWDGGNEYSKVLLTVEGDATVALPESITAEELAFDVEPGSTLTLNGPGSLAVTRAIDAVGFTLKLGGTVTFATDTTFAGNVAFASNFTKDGDGDIQLSNGATVGVDAALVVTPLGTYTLAEGTVVDSAYPSGEGDVKLIPLTSAVVSITQSGTTLYYSDLDTALGPLVNAPASISDDVVVTLLNGTTWPTTPQDYASMLRLYGYYIDNNGILTKAVARISTATYPTLADAVAAAADGATVTLLLASSEEITLNKAITLSETANFSGTLTGNGTLTFAAFRNNPSITFDNWTGTVVLPSFTADGTIFNRYGVTGSTVVLKGIDSGWLGETSAQRMDVAPTLQLDGNVTITGFSTSWDYTFAEITGTGTFSLAPADNHPKSASIMKVAEGFTGTVASSINTTLTIATLDRAAGTSTAGGTKLLSTSGNVVATALTVGGVAQQVPLCTAADGIYVACTVTIPDVANATAAVTVGGVAAEGSSPYTVDVGSNVEITWTAASGYKITANGTQTINSIAENVTATAPTVERDTKTFTVVVPANMTVTVDGEPYTADTEITRDVGATVTIVYTVSGAYAGNTQQQVITVGADTPASIATPADYVAPVPAVAQISTTYYDSLSNAFEAATADATIKVIADNTMTGNAIAFAKNLTLDLNGFVTTHAGDGHVFEPTGGATFTITDTSDGAAGKVVSGSKIVLSGSPCTFTLEAGTLQSDSVPVYIWGNGPASERVVNINGGKLVCGSNSNADSCIMVSSGTIRMSAGVIESVCCGFEGTTVNVSGGNVTVGVDKVFRRSTDRATGGTFNKDVGDYCTTGYICVNNGNGTYSVVSGGVITFVNDDGTTVLQTLKVPTGDTPAYTGETPTKTATAQYTYTFIGWTPAIAAVSGNATYTATYSSTVNQYTLTLPEVANATAVVTVGDVEQTAPFTFDYNTEVTVTWTATDGYTVTAGGTQVITLTGNTTAAMPTVRAGATVSNVNFEYGANYATATVTATVSGDATGYTLTVGQNSYNGVVSGSTVTFSNVATGHASAYDSVSYTITATDGEAAVPVTSGGSGSALVADSTAWVNENAVTTASAAAGGSWATAVTYENNVAAVSDNTFTAVNCSTGDLVTVTIENVTYADLSEMDVSEIAADSQGAFCLGTNMVNGVATPCFMILAKEGGVFVWKPATWDGTPALNTGYDVEFTFDYAHGTYSVKVDGKALSVNSSTAFALCTAKTEVKALDFMGAGKLSAIQGAGYSGYMVKDSDGTYYATIQQAVDSYSAAKTYFVLHEGTAPAGWKIETVGGVLQLKRIIKGVMILTY